MRSLSALIGGNLVALSALVMSCAQADVTSTGYELEELVVTAEKREADLQKTAMSIQVKNGEQLKNEGKNRLDEQVNGTTGLQAQGTQSGSSFSIRGVDTGTSGTNVSNAGATVAILIDGVYQNRAEVMRAATADISQLEVLRGTQSTNLGVEAVAGALSLQSNRPIFGYSASGSLQVGNYDQRGLEGMFNMPLGVDQALRLAYSSSKRDGYLSSNAGNEDLQTIRARYRWQPLDELNLQLTFERQSIGGNGTGAGLLTYNGYWESFNSAHFYDSGVGFPPTLGHVPSMTTYRQRSNPWDDGYPANTWPNNPFRDTKINSYTANIDWATKLGTLTIVPSVQHTRFHSVDPPRDNSWNGENSAQNTRQLEVRLASPESSSVQWLVGAYYYYTNLTGTFEAVTTSSVFGPTTCFSTGYCYSWNNAREVSQTNASMFGNVTYPLGKSFRLLGGLRYAHDRKTTVQSYNVQGTALGPSSSYDYGLARGSWSEPTYRVGAEYDLTQRSMFYLTYSTGYQPGVAYFDSSSSSAVVSDKNTSQQLTLGMKNMLFSNRLQVNLEAFAMTFKQRPLTDPLSYVERGSIDNCNSINGFPGLIVGRNLTCINANQSPGTVTVPVQKSGGLDVDISFLATPNDRVDVTAEYLKAFYDSKPNAPVFTVQDVLDAAGLTSPTQTQTDAATSLLANYNAMVASYKGATMQNSPKWSGAVNYEHTFHLTGGSTLVPQLHVTYKDKYWAQAEGSAPYGYAGAAAALDKGSIVRQDAYLLYDTYMTWSSAGKHFDVTGYVKNVTNKPIQTNIFGSRAPYVTLADPRTFGITLSARFQ